MRLAAIALLVIAIGAAVRTSLSYRRTQIMRSISNEVESADRFVDVGVTLHVVKADPAGTVLIEGSRPMKILRTHCLGGVVDTKANPPRFVAGRDGISTQPQTWYCSEDQERIILHRDEDPVGKLALGGMGAGKTTGGIVWLYWRWIEGLAERAAAADRVRERARVEARANGADEDIAAENAPIPKPNEIGLTSPTDPRLMVVFNEVFAMFPPHWRAFNGETKIMTLCDGTRVRGVSTHRVSQASGSRIQAFNWCALLADEIQDSTDEYVHMMARLRSKADGRAKRLATATAKDFPEWRNLKARMLESPDWVLHQLLGPNSPFIGPSHWETMKSSMTANQYRRMVLAEDLPSESRVYYTFDRKENLRPIPLGARKITSIVLSRKTGDKRDAILMGHDPGSAKAGTVWLDAYELPPALAIKHGFLPNEVLWWVRAELFTLHATHEQHATQALDVTRKRFGCNMRADSEQAHVRCQPLGGAEDKPDLSVKAIWERVGLRMKFAQYSVRNGKSQGIGQIKKESRIGVVNTLFCNAEMKRRLFLECDDRGTPMTPLLLAALETMERDHLGRAEHEEKNVKHDKSDLPAAMGYALYPFEKELAVALRTDIRKELS